MPGHNIGQAVWALVVILECLVAWAAPPAHHVVLRQGRRAHVSQKAVGSPAWAVSGWADKPCLRLTACMLRWRTAWQCGMAVYLEQSTIAVMPGESSR